MPRVLATRCRQALLVLFLAVFTISCDDGHPSQPKRKGLHVVTIDNTKPRRDVTGTIIDAHDGCLQLFGSRFYLYGTAYGTNDGYNPANRFRVYSSPDLEQWTLAGELFKDQPAGIYYRPYVVFNPKTRKFVLWYNWYPRQWDGQTGVAISDTPAGPFTIVNSNVRLSCSHAGDGSLFVDDDGTGYYIYTAIDKGYAVRVERLTPDYLGSTGETSDSLALGAKPPCSSGETTATTLCADHVVISVPGAARCWFTFPLHLWVPMAGRLTLIAVPKVAVQPYGRNKPGPWTFPEGNFPTRLPTRSPIRTMLQSCRYKKPGSQKFQCPRGRPLSGWRTGGNQLPMASKGTIFNSGVRR